MKPKNKLEKSLGKIDKSKWVENATQWEKDLPWLEYSQRIALKILFTLEEKQLSQKDYAKILGVSPQLIGKWLKGNENFTLQTIAKIENSLGITLIEIKDKNEIKKTKIGQVANNHRKLVGLIVNEKITLRKLSKPNPISKVKSY